MLMPLDLKGQEQLTGYSLMRPAVVKRFFIFFIQSFVFAIGHTRASAQEHPFRDGPCSVVDLCSVSTLVAQPVSVHHFSVPTNHLFDHCGP